MSRLPQPGKRAASTCDVMLLLEGTFPYVSGGVSSWVNQIIRGFPDLSFGICFIGARLDDYGEPKYALPENVVHMERHFMLDEHDVPAKRRGRGNQKAFATVSAFHESLRSGASVTALNAFMKEIAPQLPEGKHLDVSEFLYSKQAWECIAEQYERHCTDPSFIDYFWTVRIMHMPIWKLQQVAQDLPPARCYHAVSTGYAGLLGALLKHKTGCPLVLSEHGIYTKERKIDLFQSTWIHDSRGVFEKDATQIPYLRELWIRFFEALGKICYEASDYIVALYEANRLRQIADGAPAERTLNIANGIDLQRMAKLRALRPPSPPPVLCLIGRVVPIKDIKTFIRAMRTVVNQLPGAQGWIAGPEDEDPGYASECRSIAANLGLTENVKFLGFQNIADILPKIGLIVLSSISEALPLVLLEGFAAGVPCVATDVGSCRQLIYGLDEKDKALGPAGEVVGIAQPEELAHAAVRLLCDEARWHASQAAAIARVERYYTHDIMFGKYRAIYNMTLTDQLASVARTRRGCPLSNG
jgi:glycosyltransferase involved in cell wall biosynthesis